MGTFAALLLAAAGPAIAPPSAQGIQLSAKATATVEIIRAERVSFNPGTEDSQRRIRRKADGSLLVEFN